jgi:hypothetical protein
MVTVLVAPLIAFAVRRKAWMATMSLAGSAAGADWYELQLPLAYWKRTTEVLPDEASPVPGVTRAVCPEPGRRQPSAVTPQPPMATVGAGRRVTANAGPLHVNTVPSHSVTCTRQFQVPAVRYDGVAMLALVVRAPDDRTVALDSVVKEPPEPACTCTRAVPFCSSVLPSDQVNPAASVPVPNTTPLAVHDAPVVPADASGATAPTRARATATSGAGREVFTPAIVAHQPPRTGGTRTPFTWGAGMLTKRS